MSENVPQSTGYELKITEDDGLVTFSGPSEAFGLTELPKQAPAETPKTYTYDDLYPNADEAFALDLAKTQSEGDAFDQRKSLRLRSLVTRTAWTVAPAMELSVAARSVTPVAFTLALGGIGEAVWHSFKKDNQVLEQAAKNTSNANERVGQRYELYRKAPITDTSPDADVALYWYEPSETVNDYFGVVGGLRLMAELARDKGVQEMNVEAHQYELICRSVDGADRDKPIISAKQAFKPKGVAVSELKDPPAFIAGTPEDWLEFADSIQERTVESLRGKLTVAQVKDMLRTLAPNNELLTLVDTYDNKQLTEDDVRTYRGKVNALLRTRFVRQEQYPERAKEFKKDGRPYMPHEVTDVEMGNLSADARQVVWETKRNGRKLQETVNAFGLTTDEYEYLIRQDTAQDQHLNIDAFTNALELALVRHAYGQPISDQKKAPQNVVLPARSWAVKTMQEELFDHKSRGAHLLAHRRRQIMSAGALMLASASALIATHTVVDAKESMAIEYSRVQIANDRHVDPSFVSDKDAKDYLDSRSPWYSGWHAYRAAEDAINPSWKDLDISSSPEGSEPEGASTSSTNSLVGNTYLPDTPDFKITPHNGANPEGFWEAKTSQILMVQEPSQVTGRGFSLTWLQENMSTDQIATYELPATLPKSLDNKPTLEVHRHLNSKDFFQTPRSQKGIDVTSMANIPIREGMGPVAASVDGKSVRMVMKKDGTYGITSKSGQAVTGDLTYWLESHPGRKVKNPGTLLELGVTDNNKGQTTFYYDSALNNVPELGQAGRNHFYRLQVLGGKVSDLGGVQRYSIKQYAKGYEQTIRDKWKYSFTPFKDDEDREWKSLDDFIKAAEAGKKANCNVANTLVGLQDIESAQVFGYLNGPGSGANVLSKNESHQKRTDGDATPIVQATELPPKKPIKLPVPPDALLLAGGAALTLSQQRRIRHALRAVATHRDKSLQSSYDEARRDEHAAHYNALITASDEHIARARAVAEHVLYAPNVNLVSVARSAQRTLEQAVPPAELLLHETQYSNGAVVAHLRTEAKNIRRKEPELASELDRSAQILSRAEQVIADRNSDPEVVVSGLTRALNATHNAATRFRQRLTFKSTL